MANINPPDSRPSLVKVPSNYPMVPQPGKISLLFETNKKSLYHKLSPWDFDSGNYFGSNQPYIYRYPDEPPSSFMTTGGRGLPMGYGIDDLVRVTKFIASGRGLMFVGKQFLLQGYQKFDETNLYNPTEVIISAAANLTGGLLEKPKRHIDKSGGLLGGLAALVGVSVSRGNPPPSTVAAGDGSGGSSEGRLFGGFSLTGGGNRETEVLPVQNYGNGTGLLRAGTANKARSILQQKWSTPTGGSGGGFLGFLKGIAKSIFPQAFGADKQNYKQRADDVTYEWMVKYYNDYTAVGLAKGVQNSGLSIGFMGINLKTSPSKTSVTQVSNSNNLFKLKYYKDVNGESKIYIKEGSYFVSNDDYKSELETKFDNGKGNFNKLNDVSKFDTPASQINESLKRVINNIGNSGIYTVNFDNKDTWLLSSGQPSKQGYDRLHDIAKTPYNMKNNKNSVESAYYDGNIRTLDSIINPNKNYGLAGNGRPDKINTLTVLDKERTIKKENQLLAGYTEWKPYDDDLIAFFFYDVVNEKYIPFRATVKNLSEANNALWDELRFIGRSDALYSYTGFTRNLSFSFNVVINSLIELWPTWQRINYLASAVKPSNYTKKSQRDGVTNRFIIPPMFMLTIGDLYKYQPIVITTVAINIPEGASWETVPENSSEDWSYMAKIIKSTKVDRKKIGQVPREIEVSVACNVLEKERPQVGGCHYGHAVRAQFSADSKTEHLQYMEDWSKNIRSVKLADVDD